MQLKGNIRMQNMMGGWQYVFPTSPLSTDPGTGAQRRTSFA